MSAATDITYKSFYCLQYECFCLSAYNTGLSQHTFQRMNKSEEFVCCLLVLTIFIHDGTNKICFSFLPPINKGAMSKLANWARDLLWVQRSQQRCIVRRFLHFFLQKKVVGNKSAKEAKSLSSTSFNCCERKVFTHAWTDLYHRPVFSCSVVDYLL